MDPVLDQAKLERTGDDQRTDSEEDNDKAGQEDLRRHERNAQDQPETHRAHEDLPMSGGASRWRHQCASATIEAEELKGLDTSKRDAHDAGAKVLQELLASTMDLSHPAARRFFSLLYLIWVPETVHELTTHHHP